MNAGINLKNYAENILKTNTVGTTEINASGDNVRLENFNQAIVNEGRILLL